MYYHTPLAIYLFNNTSFQNKIPLTKRQLHHHFMNSPHYFGSVKFTTLFFIKNLYFREFANKKSIYLPFLI